MDDPDPDTRVSRTQHVCSLQKDGRHVSFLLTDMEGGGFELKLVRSDAATRSVQLYRVRADATAEAERRISRYMAHGWSVSERR